MLATLALLFSIFILLVADVKIMGKLPKHRSLKHRVSISVALTFLFILEFIALAWLFVLLQIEEFLPYTGFVMLTMVVLIPLVLHKPKLKIVDWIFYVGEYSLFFLIIFGVASATILPSMILLMFGAMILLLIISLKIKHFKA